MPDVPPPSPTTAPPSDDLLLRFEAVNDTWGSPNHAILVLGRRGEDGFARVFAARDADGGAGRMNHITAIMTAGQRAVEAACAWAEASLAARGAPVAAGVHIDAAAVIRLPWDARARLNAACGIGYGRNVPRHLSADVVGGRIAMSGQSAVLKALVAMDAGGAPVDLDGVLEEANGIEAEYLGNDGAWADGPVAAVPTVSAEPALASPAEATEPADPAAEPARPDAGEGGAAQPKPAFADPGLDPLFVRIESIKDATQPKRQAWCVGVLRRSCIQMFVCCFGDGRSVIPAGGRVRALHGALAGIAPVLAETIERYGVPSSLGVAGDPLGNIAGIALPVLEDMLARLGAPGLPLAGYHATVAALPIQGIPRARKVLRATPPGAEVDFETLQATCRSAFGIGSEIDAPASAPEDAGPAGPAPEADAAEGRENRTDTAEESPQPAETQPSGGEVATDVGAARPESTEPAAEGDGTEPAPTDEGGPVVAARGDEPVASLAGAEAIRIRINPVNACGARGPFGALVIATLQDRVAVRAVMSAVDETAVNGANMGAKRREARLQVRTLAEDAAVEAALEVGDGVQGAVALGAVASLWNASVVGLEDRIAENAGLVRLPDDPPESAPPAVGNDLLRDAMRRRADGAGIDTPELRDAVRDLVLASLHTTRKAPLPPIDDALPAACDDTGPDGIGPRPRHVPATLCIGASGAGKSTLVAALLGTEAERFPATSPSRTTTATIEVRNVPAAPRWQLRVEFRPRSAVETALREMIRAAAMRHGAGEPESAAVEALMTNDDQWLRLEHIYGPRPAEPGAPAHEAAAIRGVLALLPRLAAAAAKAGRSFGRSEDEEEIADALLRSPATAALASELAADIGARVAELPFGRTETDRQGFPTRLRYACADRAAAFAALGRFYRNDHASRGKLFGSLVSSIVIEGPICPGMDPFVLVDAQGIDHVGSAGATLSGDLIAMLPGVHTVLLVQNAVKAGDTAATAALSRILAVGQGSKLALVLTHMDALEGESFGSDADRRDFAQRGVTTMLAAAAREVGGGTVRRLRQEGDRLLHFLGGLHLAPAVRTPEAVAAIEGLRRVLQTPPPDIPDDNAAPIYRLDGFDGMIGASASEWWDDQAAQLGGGHVHWMSVKAFNRRACAALLLPDAPLPGLATYSPFSDLRDALLAAASKRLDTPHHWWGKPTEARALALIDAVREDFAQRMPVVIRAALLDAHAEDWRRADRCTIATFGPGCTRERARLLGEVYRSALHRPFGDAMRAAAADAIRSIGSTAEDHETKGAGR